MTASLVMILVAAAVFLLSLIVFSVFSRAFARYQERYVVRSMNDLGEMFLFVDARALLVLNFATMALFVIGGLLVFGPIAAVILAIAGFFAPTAAVRYYRKRRLRQFDGQLVEALQAMANAFRAGLTFPQAVEFVAKEAPAPLAQEFGLLVKELKLGVPLEDALVSTADRVGSADLELVVVATNVARHLGGNMAEIYETISATVRERFRLEGKIDALTSQGKLQGWVVGFAPVALGFALNALRPDLMQPMLNDWFGYGVITVIGVMIALGIFFIRKIVTIEV